MHETKRPAGRRTHRRTGASTSRSDARRSLLRNGRSHPRHGLLGEMATIFLDIKPVDGGIEVCETRCGISMTGKTRDEALAAFWQTFFALPAMIEQALADNWDEWDDERASVFSELHDMLEQSDEPLREAMHTELRACVQYIRQVQEWELHWCAAQEAKLAARAVANQKQPPKAEEEESEVA